MERETTKVLWWVFGISVMTFAVVPAAWSSFSHGSATGSVQDASMANALWGQQRQVSGYTQNWAGDTNVPSIPGAIEAQIQQVTWDTSVWGPKVTLTGYGFGNPPAQGQPVIQIADSSRGWTASSASLKGVQPHIAKWTNEEIVIDEFSNYGSADPSNWSNGLGSWVFARGDNIQFSVTNAQSGAVGTLTTTYPSDAPMPTVNINVPSNIIGGVKSTFSGTVTFNGQPLANQAVSLSSSHGSMSGAGTQTTPTEYMVFTNAQGQWTADYTPALPGGTTETFTAMSDSVSNTQSLNVLPGFKVTLTATGDQTDNNVTLTAQVNYPLNGFTLKIVNQTTGQVVASTTQGTTLTTVITAAQQQTQTFVAQIY